jgi:PAS domain S-box-containing protein
MTSDAPSTLTDLLARAEALMRETTASSLKLEGEAHGLVCGISLRRKEPSGRFQPPAASAAEDAGRRLKTTERDLQVAIDTARLTVWEWDIATHEVRWSDGVQKIFSLAPGSFPGTMEAYRALILPEDLPTVQSALDAALRQEAPYSVEHRIRWPDGQIRWLQCHGIVIRDTAGAPLRMFGTVVDVTDRVRTEQALRERLAASNARLLSAQEEERRRLARELHDDHCQQIVSVVLQLEMVRKAHPDVAELAPIIQDLKDLLQDIRTLVQGLHPPLLERQGLVPALRHHLDACRARSGLSIRFTASPIEGLTSEQALCLFRVAQEALHNVVKHAQASGVIVDLRMTATAVLLTVQDNGRGYDVERVLASAAGLGLLGMRERVEQQHGTLTFTSAPGKGTTVTARLPIRQ